VAEPRGDTGQLAMPAGAARPAGDLLVGLGNSLRGDDGVGVHLAGWAERRWPVLQVRSVQQLTPELCCELSLAQRVLFIDAWQVATTPCGTGETPKPPGTRQPPAGGDRCAAMPILIPLNLPSTGADGGAGAWAAFSHQLDPAQLLAITALLYGHAPQAWLLLVPAFQFAHGQELSWELQRQLPRARTLLRRWRQTSPDHLSHA